MLPPTNNITSWVQFKQLITNLQQITPQKLMNIDKLQQGHVSKFMECVFAENQTSKTLRAISRNRKSKYDPNSGICRSFVSAKPSDLGNSLYSSIRVPPFFFLQKHVRETLCCFRYFAEHQVQEFPKFLECVFAENNTLQDSPVPQKALRHQHIHFSDMQSPGNMFWLILRVSSNLQLQPNPKIYNICV